MRSRIAALSVSLALGAALAIPAATSVAYAESVEAAGALPIADCKIPTLGVGTFNEGFERDYRAASPTGTLTVQVVYLEFPDLALGAAGNNSLEQVHDGITASVDRLQNLSDGRLQVTVLEYADPVMMPNPITDYPADELSAWSGATWMTFVVDGVMAAASSVDFAASDVVWMFFPWASPLPTRAAADNLIYIQEGGPPAERAVTLPMVQDTHPEETLVHETGHTFGLPDLYDTSGQLPEAQFVSDWDLMGWAPGGEFFSWHRWRLDWIDDSQVRCIAPGGGGGLDVTLHALTRNGPTMAAVIPTSDHRVLVVESRRPDRYNESWLHGGLFIYIVSSDVETGAGPVRVAPKDGMEPPQFFADFENAPLNLSDRYTDTASGTVITVIDSTDWTDTIRIAPEAAPTPPPIEPETPESPSALPASRTTPTLPPTGQETTGAVTLSAGLLAFGALVITASRLRSRRDKA